MSAQSACHQPPPWTLGLHSTTGLHAGACATMDAWMDGRLDGLQNRLLNAQLPAGMVGCHVKTS